ncbi:MAG: S41 family peptidase [Pseudomonadota bacterium]
MSILSRVCIAAMVGLTLALALVAGDRLILQRDSATTITSRPSPLLNEVLERVHRDYVDPVDDSELMEAAVRGMVADLDPHSEFLDASAFEDVRSGAEGRYSGVGLEVALREGDVTVITPFEGSPAQRAGIRTGDIILAIDEMAVSTTALQETVSRMRGPSGSAVTLSVLREGFDAPLRFNLERERLTVESVQGALLAPDIGHLVIRQFHTRTAVELELVLRELTEENLTPLRAIVLDLRNNPGGLLDSAIAVTDLFLEEGLIVSARGRGDDAAFEYLATRGSLLPDAQMVVLVNGASASAAEIVAGALKDHERARLIGTSTFGKGLVQTVMPLSRGRAIKLTTSRYYTPDGHYIHDRGITPNIVVRDNGPEDRQLARALQELTGGHRR